MSEVTSYKLQQAPLLEKNDTLKRQASSFNFIMNITQTKAELEI
jgi:hypothetical protein